MCQYHAILSFQLHLTEISKPVATNSVHMCVLLQFLTSSFQGKVTHSITISCHDGFTFALGNRSPVALFFRKLQLQNWILDKALSKYLRTRVNFKIGGRILEKLFLSKIISCFENFCFRMNYQSNYFVQPCATLRCEIHSLL